jgi:ribonuclease E
MQGNDETTEDTTSEGASASAESNDVANAGEIADAARPRKRRRAASRAAGPPVTPPEESTANEPSHDDSGGKGTAVPVLFQAPAFEAPLPLKTEQTKVEQPKADPKSGNEKNEKRAKRRDAGDAVSDDEQMSKAAAATVNDHDDDDEDDDDDGTPRRRRRRRGGRGRKKKPDSVEGATDDETDADAPETADNGADGKASDQSPDQGADDSSEESDDGSAGTRRRRRRKRKGDSEDRRPDDPPNTVVKVREGKEAGDDEVTSVKGSTRLEAKKQRRREGREAGRRKPPILSEAEFLARREAVDRVMAVRQEGELTQIGVLEDDVLVEHYVSRSTQTSLIGNVYLGRVQNVLPAMEAAFVDIGKGRNAVIYAGEVDWSDREGGGGERRIEDVLKSGQPVLVQVTKDPVGHKGARLTSQISLPGRYVVYVPRGSMSGISRKLPDTERTRLKKILKQVVPDDAGVIVRTAAEGASEEELTNDVARLRDQWESIKKRSSGNAPTLLQSEPNLDIKVVRDLFNEDFTRLVVSGDDAWNTLNDYIGTVAGSLHDRLDKWTPGDGRSDIFDALRMTEQINKALERKVWLPSGGSLVIDRTEAMTVIDVNTGKFTGSGGNLEETVTKNNLEAAEEIVRQLRLRDIGGIIVIDFIDMVLEANRDLVLRRLVECLGRDRTKHQVAEVTSLGLVQMTRKRIGTGLLEAFGELCPHCRGRGMVVHDHPVDSADSNGGSGDGGRGSDGGSGGRSRRGRRRSSSDTGASSGAASGTLSGGDSGDSSGSADVSEQETAAENNHKPKLEASADPEHASPADLMPVPDEPGSDSDSVSSATGNGTSPQQVEAPSTDDKAGVGDTAADHVV